MKYVCIIILISILSLLNIFRLSAQNRDVLIHMDSDTLLPQNDEFKLIYSSRKEGRLFYDTIQELIFINELLLKLNFDNNTVSYYQVNKMDSIGFRRSIDLSRIKKLTEDLLELLDIKTNAKDGIVTENNTIRNLDSRVRHPRIYKYSIHINGVFFELEFYNNMMPMYENLINNYVIQKGNECTDKEMIEVLKIEFGKICQVSRLIYDLKCMLESIVDETFEVKIQDEDVFENYLFYEKTLERYIEMYKNRISEK